MQNRRQRRAGLYIYGEVGRGKTFLMDLFFAAAEVEPKRRAHFHAFMADVHARVHVWRQARKRGEAEGDEPIAPLADALAQEATLLCFDEFAVRDIADAIGSSPSPSPRFLACRQACTRACTSAMKAWKCARRLGSTSDAAKNRSIRNVLPRPTSP